MLLACREITKAFDGVPVLKGGGFHLEEKEKAAIVGINGAGKSTLLNILTGRLPADSGEVFFPSAATFGYLTQHQDTDSGQTLYEEVASARRDVLEREQELRLLEEEMARLSGDALERAMTRYSELSHRFEEEGGYACRSEIAGVIKGLGFSEADFDKPCRTLSGGEKTRAALGRLLLTAPSLILLDEPTNHLDIRSVSWLENYLRDYPGAVLIVSHDRYFMDRVVTKVIEVENGRISQWTGNYSAYAQKKSEARAAALKHYLEQQKKIRHEEEVIAKLKSFNREKSIKRAESREKQLAKLDRLERPAEQKDAMGLRLSSAGLTGQDVLSIRHLSKSFGRKTVLDDLSLEIKRGEKTALIGDNGCGKSTLLKILCGQIPADAGDVRLGSQVKLGYYDQEQQLFTETNTLFEEVREAYPAMTDTEIRSALAAFLFPGDAAFKQVCVLSGGERGRLSLLKLMLSPCNFLVLDEPTNHLDITSREILEEALLAFEGTLFFVSHDRYFINRLAARTLEMAGGHLTSYLGNYDDYLEKKAENTAASVALKPAERSLTSAARERQAKKEAETVRRRHANELARTEAAIEEAEAALSLLEERMASPENASDAAALLALSREAESLKEQIGVLYERWEALTEKADL